MALAPGKPAHWAASASRRETQHNTGCSRGPHRPARGLLHPRPPQPQLPCTHPHPASPLSCLGSVQLASQQPTPLHGHPAPPTPCPIPSPGVQPCPGHLPPLTATLPEPLSARPLTPDPAMLVLQSLYLSRSSPDGMRGRSDPPVQGAVHQQNRFLEGGVFLVFTSAPLFFFFKHLYWSIIALQWCVSFCFITK